ncbi:hypothetical protein VTN31DRAFT_6375 [Thermomyces dupontii]|uniref:uncharacterized protein n=1 Tax=Talaromyces thermophilus TaxID=28565 RepID=UPI003743C758
MYMESWRRPVVLLQCQAAFSKTVPRCSVCSLKPQLNLISSILLCGGQLRDNRELADPTNFSPIFLSQ